MKHPIKSSLNLGDSYTREHVILEDLFALYHKASMSKHISFSEYVDCVMRLDSARHNHEVHNFFKAEHNINEHFSLGSLEDEEDL